MRVVPGITEGCALAAEAQRRKHLPALLAPADFQEARSGEGDSQTDIFFFNFISFLNFT